MTNMLMWAVSLTTHENITVSVILNRLNYCVIFIVCIQFANVAAGRVREAGGGGLETTALLILID
jgi:hypothetical protein